MFGRSHHGGAKAEVGKRILADEIGPQSALNPSSKYRSIQDLSQRRLCGGECLTAR